MYSSLCLWNGKIRSPLNRGPLNRGLTVHATSNKYCRLVGGVFCLILPVFEGPRLRDSITGYFCDQKFL